MCLVGKGSREAAGQGGSVPRMSRSLVLPWDDALLDYDFGNDHPLNTIRVDLTIRLARELGLLDLTHVEMRHADGADDDLAALGPDGSYLEREERVGADPSRPDEAHGL